MWQLYFSVNDETRDVAVSPSGPCAAKLPQIRLSEPAPAGLFLTPTPRAAVYSWFPQGKRNVEQSKCSTLGESLNKLCYIFPMQYYIIVKSHVSSKTNDLDKQSYYML